MDASLSNSTALTGETYPIFPQAIVFATFSLLVVLLIIPPLIWHAQNRNVGASVLVLLAIIANFQNTVNAVIWPNDDIKNWWQGRGLCDVEVKVQSAMSVAFPASVCCILRGLANAMDTERSSWNQTTAQKRRVMMIDLLCCVLLPLLQMPFHYIVQPFRYYILGIAGCEAAVDKSWLYFVLMLLPQILWFLAAAYYGVLILIRLVRYRLAFSSIMANNNTTRSRFLRLYVLCTICTIGLLASEAFVVHENVVVGLTPYSWDATHNSNEPPWNSVVMVRSYGIIFYDRYVWLFGGVTIFLLFGFGRDAVKMYRSGLISIGMGRVFPSLHSEYPGANRGSFATSLSSMGSKAKLYFKRKSAMVSSGTNTTGSSSDDGYSPKKATFLSTISEGPHPSTKRPIPSRLTAVFQKKMQVAERSETLLLSSMSGTPTTMCSNVSASPMSPIRASHVRCISREDEMIIKKEVRQDSEAVETLPAKAYEI